MYKETYFQPDQLKPEPVNRQEQLIGSLTAQLEHLLESSQAHKSEVRDFIGPNTTLHVEDADVDAIAADGRRYTVSRKLLDNTIGVLLIQPLNPPEHSLVAGAHDLRYEIFEGQNAVYEVMTAFKDGRLHNTTNKLELATDITEVADKLRGLRAVDDIYNPEQVAPVDAQAA